MVKNYNFSGLGTIPVKTDDIACKPENKKLNKKTGTLLMVLVMLSLLAGKNATAQSMANYTFATNTNGSLALDMNSNAIDMSTGTTQLLAASSDDNASAATGIGFDFFYMGGLYTQFYATSNGLMQLGGTAAPSQSTYTITSGTVAAPHLSAFCADLKVGSTGKIHYKTIGTAPNRVTVVEFSNMQLFYYSTTTETGNSTWQVRFYESSGTVEYVYGTMNVVNVTGSNKSPSIGFYTSSATNNFLSVAYAANATSVTNPYAANPAVTANGNITNLNSSANGSRRYYRFIPPGNTGNTVAATLAAPTNFTVLNPTATGGTLSWQAASPATGVVKYVLYYSVDNGVTYTYFNTVTASTTTQGVTSQTPGYTYKWKIYSLSEGGKSADLIGTQATPAAATYYWVGATGGDWNTGTNWNTSANGTGTARTADASDILIVDGAGSTPGSGGACAITISGSTAAISVGALRVTSGTTLTLTSSIAAKTITITGAAGEDFEITSGSGLIINNTTAVNAVAITFSGTSLTGTIAGTLTVGGLNTNSFATSTGVVVTVSGTGVVNCGSSNLGTVTGTVATLKFASGATYNHLYNNNAGTIPTADWNTGSTVIATSYTNFLVPAGVTTQTLGNFTYGFTATTGGNMFATSTVSIGGNFNISSTGTGTLALLTTGTLNVGGNLIISAGTVQQGSTSGTATVNVTGNVSVNGGSFSVRPVSGLSNLNVTGNIALTGGTLELTNNVSGITTIKVGGNFTQTGGSLTVPVAGVPLIEFNGTAAQTCTVTSTLAYPVSFRINNTAGVSLTGTVPVSSLNVIKGNLTGSGSVTYPATGSASLSYTGTTGTQIANAFEWPATGGPTNVTINNTTTAPNNTVTIPFSRALPSTGVLTLTAGIFNNDGYTLTVNNTAVAAVTGYSTTKYITGGLERVLPASLATGSNYGFPVGKGTVYSPFELVNPTTAATGTVTVKAEAKAGATGGSFGTGMSSLNTNKYWEAGITAGAANFTDTFIKLTDTDAGIITSTSAVAAASALTGTYNLVGGTTPTVVTGTSVQTVAPKATTLPGYFAMGIKGVDMAYVSSTSTQSSTANIVRPLQGQPALANQQIIAIQVVTSGNINAALATQLQLSTAGSTAPATDIAKARVYYTGTSATYATTTQFGSDVISPSGAFNVTGSQVLAEGTNYFWLVYDIPFTAVGNNIIDAQVLGVTVAGTTQTPTVTSPAGSRTIKAPLSGDYTIGTAANYTTITAAVNALNTYGVEGPVRFLIATGTYSGSSTETFPMTINAIVGASATNTIKFLPASGATVTITGNGNSSPQYALITLNGTNYLTIDGSNNGTATKNLTIVNTSSSANILGTIVFTNGASNNTIKNTIVQGCGTGTNSGVVLFATASATSGNNYNTITANDITKGSSSPVVGVQNTGTSGLPNTGNTISYNRIMDFSGIGFEDGNTTSYSANTLVEGNEIFQNSTQTGQLIGIYLDGAAGVTNMVISKNKIYNLTTTYTSPTYVAAMGISVYHAASVKISNNTIALSNNTGLIRGINQSSAAGSTLEAYYNTVSISGNVSGAYTSAAYYKDASASTDIVKNNIFVNTRTSTGTTKQYAIDYETTATSSTLDYNEYYSSGNALNVLGIYGGTDRATLANWQAATSQDAHSVNTPAVFTSGTDLHLVPASNPTLDNLGTPVAGITTDIDNATRSTTIPDMGADEFLAPACTGAVAGTATAGAAICSSGTTTITATGYTQAASITYQWQSSNAANGTYTDIGTASGVYANYTTPTLTATTYYRLKVTCTAASATDYSAVATAYVSAPAITATTPGTRCGTGTVQLGATASADATVKWYAAATGGNSLASGTTFTTPSLTTTTTYYAEAAGSNATIGAGTSTGIATPYNFTNGTYGGTKVQYLFTAAELQAAGIQQGVITKIAFEFTTAATNAYGGFTVQMGTTALSAFPSTANIQGGLTTVKSPTSLSVVAGTNTITFDAPFNWNGTSNVIVSVSYSNNNSSNTASTIKYNTTSFVSSQSYVKDNETSANMAAFTGTATNTSSGSLRAMVTFTGCTAATRAAVVATINTPTAVTLTNSGNSSTEAICPGTSTGTVSANGASGIYNGFTVTSVPAGAAWSGTLAAGFTFTPAVSTVYTINLTQSSGSMCATSATYSVTVKPAPAAVVVTPSSSSICIGEIVALTATGGTSSAATVVFTESFNANSTTLANWGVANNNNQLITAADWALKTDGYSYAPSTSGSPSVIFHSNDNSQFYIANTDAYENGASYITRLTSPVFSLAGYTSAQLDFYHFFEVIDGTADVEIKIGTADWQTLQTYNAEDGTSTAFAHKLITLPAEAMGSSSVRIRFKYTADWDYYWAVDNVTITAGTVTANPVTWTSAGAIYTDSAAQTPYVAGTNATTVYVKPTAQTAYTATATSSGGCTTNGTTTVAIGSKYWNGNAGTDWGNAANWCGNVLPTATDDVVIPGTATAANQPKIASGTVAYTKNITVQDGATVTVKKNATLDVQNYIYVSTNATIPGNIIVRDSAAIRQHTNIANEGKITVYKYSNPLFRLDYTMWGSPVSNQMLQAFSPATLSNRFYTYGYNWDATLSAGAAYVEQFWGVAAPATTPFTPGKGYLIRTPNFIEGPAPVSNAYAAGTQTSRFEGIFKGVPNNGDVNIPVSVANLNPAVGGMLSQQNHYVAVANPYPSPINVSEFFTLNQDVLEAGKGIYFWRKTNNSGGNANNVNSYCTLTMAGFTTNLSAGGAVGNGSEFYPSPSGSAFNTNWIIAPGQGFLIKVKDNIEPSLAIKFTNSIRRNAPVSGGQPFFKTLNNNNDQDAEISRVWLNLTDGSNGYAQSAIAYIDGATPDLDYGYDGAMLSNGGTVKLYSIVAENKLAIQARPSFTVTDVVPMGLSVPAAGQYTVSIDHMDGVFSAGQDVFIKDNLLGITHNIKQSDYVFTSDAGTYESRFEVVYMPAGELGTQIPELSNMVTVYQQNGTIHINCGTAEMSEVTIYDIRGRLLYKKENINSIQTAITGLHVAQEVIIVEVNTNRGMVSKKIIF